MAELIKLLKEKNRSTGRGDTIVEVLIAISIAAFAIGISYATANRSLQQAIFARERNEALNVLQNQIADLKFRHQKTPSANFTKFEPPAANHFCLDDTAIDPAAASWAPVLNSSSVTATSPLRAANPATKNAPYNSNCVRSSKYYIDIVTQTAAGNQNPTVYQVIVSWNPLNGQQLDQASVYYRF